MEMNNIPGGGSHVAQHRWRDKLRAQQQNSFDHNFEQLWLHQVHIPDPDDQFRNFKYGALSPHDQTVFSSQTLNSATKCSQNDCFSNSMISSYLPHPDSSSNLNLLADNYTGNLNASFLADVTNDVCAYPRQPHCYSYQDVAHSSLGESSNNIITSPFDYQNTLVNVEELDMARYSAKDSNEVLLHFLPSFGESNSLSNTPVDQAFRQWNVESVANKSHDPQGLSLSLSVDILESSNLDETRCSKAFKYSNYLCSTTKQSSAGSKGGYGVEYGRRNIYNVAGPHGPFTGYASILKDSKYLKPTLELLEDLCGSKQKISEIYPDKIDDEEEFSGSSVSESSWPTYHKKMVNLLYLQQEVS